MIDVRHIDWDKPGTPCVNVVESPGPRDLLMENQEGSALHAALRQARIPCRYYLATNKAMLLHALEFIARQRLHALHNHYPPQPIALHISAHGNTNGIALTDQEFIPWDELHLHLLAFSRQSLTFYEVAKVSSIVLCMSSCVGLAAASMGNKPERPFMTLVAPNRDVLWSDSLVSFLTFYNLFLLKNLPCGEAIRGMNAAAGISDLFHVVDYSDEVKRAAEQVNDTTK
jgi:hypothetical protein